MCCTYYSSHGVTKWLRWEWKEPFLKQSSLQQIVKDCIQGFKYLQGRRLRNLTEQPVSVLSHPHSKKAFPDVQREHVFQLVPIASCAEEKRVLCLYADYSTELC